MKKGFTIAEMLGVVIILCIIGVIAFPPILNLVKQTEKDIDNSTKELVITAAGQYISRNENDFSKKINNEYYIMINDLINTQLVSNSVFNETSLTEESCVKVTVNKDYKYEYEVEVTCSN
ncbi:MAG: type II secretion system protein [Firmicutes bacterium]|nr:type II secretion system protein [Bacillota bacterium]